ncbi:hypothetical protein [Endothiovibrio diazotrophicus]
MAVIDGQPPSFSVLISDPESGAVSVRLKDAVIKVLAALDLGLSVIARRKDGFDPTASCVPSRPS